MGQFRRIMVIGGSGAGKTTVARQLAFLSRLPLHHIDAMYWNTAWTPRGYDQTVLLSSIAAYGEKWIIEGNYEPTMALRAERADLIIFLDFSRGLRSFRVALRFLKFWGKRRPELPYGCIERFDFRHLHDWVWRYDQHSRPFAQALLEEWQGQRDIIHLRRPADLRRLMADDSFLAKLTKTPQGQDFSQITPL